MTGLLPGYNNSILKMIIISSGVCLIEMRNPWGEGGMEWNGDWSDTCPLWTQEIKVSLDIVFSCDLASVKAIMILNFNGLVPIFN